MGATEGGGGAPDALAEALADVTVTTHEGRPFCTSPADVVQLHGGRLSPLLGKRVESGWVAWDLAVGEWFESEPVVLRIGDTNIELLHTQLSMLWIGYDSLDLLIAPAWHSCWAGEIDLEWRRDAHPVITAAIGRRVLNILLVEYRTRFWPADAPDAPPPVSGHQKARDCGEVKGAS